MSSVQLSGFTRMFVRWTRSIPAWSLWSGRDKAQIWYNRCLKAILSQSGTHIPPPCNMYSLVRTRLLVEDAMKKLLKNSDTTYTVQLIPWKYIQQRFGVRQAVPFELENVFFYFAVTNHSNCNIYSFNHVILYTYFFSLVFLQLMNSTRRRINNKEREEDIRTTKNCNRVVYKGNTHHHRHHHFHHYGIRSSRLGMWLPLII